MSNVLNVYFLFLKTQLHLKYEEQDGLQEVISNYETSSNFLSYFTNLGDNKKMQSPERDSLPVIYHRSCDTTYHHDNCNEDAF